MMNSMIKPSAPIAKGFLDGFVKNIEMSVHYLVFQLLYFLFSKC